MALKVINTETLDAIADAINAKTGKTGKLTLDQMPEEISSIEAGTDTSDAKFVRCLIRNGIGCIDTGVDGANSNLSVEIRYEYDKLPSGYWNLLYAYTDESTNATRITANKDTYTYICLNSVPSKSLASTQKRFVGVVYTDVIKPTSSSNFSYTTNGTTSSATRTSGKPLENKTMLLFARSTITDGVSIRLYYLKIYDGGTLIRDYLPYVTEDGEYGLYDKVTKQFYGNITNGVFEAEVD